MPWRGPTNHPREIPTLGPLVGDWIQNHCVVPDGDWAGDKFKLIPDQWKFLDQFYRLKDDAEINFRYPGRAFVHTRGGQLVQPQKWGKGPFSAAIICAEAAGPVLFDGWDENGDPKGREWPTPWIQVTASTEEQTDNVWRALIPMITLGALKAEMPDTGITRINLPNGGIIEPVTSAGRSRLGQRVTFVVQDEAHDWTKRNGGRKLADNQRRNLAGTSGRFMETGNAWDPAEDSVAQQTWESKEPGVYKMKGDCAVGSIRNKQERRKMLRKLYKQCWWIDTDRIEAEILDLLQRDPAQAERFFLNRIHAAEDAAFDLARWNELANPTLLVPDRSLIVIGVDGARSDDALAVIATDISQSHQFVLGIWERPQGAPTDYVHDLAEVDVVMQQAFAKYKVNRVYVDPGSYSGNIAPLIETWQGRWDGKTIAEFPTNSWTRIAHAVANFTLAMNAKELTHDGDSTFARHIGNARRRSVGVLDENNRRMWTIAKDRDMSKNKMDAAMAAVISWEARADAITAGMLKRQSSVYETRGVELL